MEIRRVPVSRLNPAAYNPRKDLRPGDAEYQKLARSMDKFGCVEPVVWNERTGNVVGGHQRLKILIADGVTELDVSVVNLSKTDEKALNIALNKIAGEWDEEGLTKLLEELAECEDVDETITGFDQKELDNLLASLADATRDFALFEAEPDPDPYVDGFFESGAQTKPKEAAAKSARQEAEQAADCNNIVVYGLTPDSMEVLTVFLKENGFTYRLEAGGA